MTKTQFYGLVDQLLELEPGTIRGDTVLGDLSQWDSLALIGFIALLDQNFGISVPAAKILECKSASDLAALTGDKIQG